jgi:hypothetical protein
VHEHPRRCKKPVFDVSTEHTLPNRLYFYAYEVSQSELQSYYQIASSALQTIPPVKGFAFRAYRDPERTRRFAEIFVMADPEVFGQDAAMRGYHFSSSYQPERATCFEAGARIASFCGLALGAESPAPFEGKVMRWTPLWAEPDDAPVLEEALTKVAAGLPGRVQTLALSSTEIPKAYALCETFESDEALAASSDAEGGASDELKSALEAVRAATRAETELPAVFNSLS